MPDMVDIKSFFNKSKKQIAAAAAIVIVVSAVIFFHNRGPDAAYYQTEMEARRAAFSALVSAIEKFGADIAFYYKDLSDGFEYSYKGDEKYPSASLVKVPVMACVYSAIEEGRLSPYQKIIYRPRHKTGGSGSIRRSRFGRKFGIEELTYRMIVESDNVATNMLCEALGLGYINEKMINWGFSVTDMKRWVLDLKRRNQGIENYTTAKEMGILLEKIYRGELVSGESSVKMINIMKHQLHRNRIPRYLPSDIEVANKTGLMRDVVHDAGIIFSPAGDYILVVLTRDLPSRKGARVIGEVSYAVYNAHMEGAKNRRGGGATLATLNDRNPDTTKSVTASVSHLEQQ